MRKEILIIGNGAAGLLLALGLRKANFPVTILYRTSNTNEDSALICPQLVIDFLEELLPGLSETLQNSGAKIQSHSEMIKAQFKAKEYIPVVNSGFLFIGRKLFLEELSLAARQMGIKFVNEEVKGFEVHDQTITSIMGSSQIWKSDIVFDCTGSPFARKNWAGNTDHVEKIEYAGIEENIFQRFFTTTVPARLVLKSLPDCRGGIYPIESNRFVLSLSCPAGEQTLESIESYSKGFTSLIGGTDILNASTPECDWNVITKKSYISNYYEFPEFRLKNFFPVGDGVLCSHPLYGRGISTVVLQIRPLLKIISDQSSDEELLDALMEGFWVAEKKWNEVSGQTRFTGGNLIKQWALKLVENDPTAYEQWLMFYQLQCTPLELFLRLLVSPYRKMKAKQTFSS